MIDKTRDLNPLISLTDEVMRLQGRLKSLFAGVQNETGLSAVEELVLSAIVDARTAPTVPQIGRSLGHPRQVIQRAANGLMAKALVEKAPNPHHKRAALLTPTPEGEKLKRQSDERALRVVDSFLSGVDVEKCDRLAGELREFRQAIERYARMKGGSDA